MVIRTGVLGKEEKPWTEKLIKKHSKSPIQQRENRQTRGLVLVIVKYRIVIKIKTVTKTILR